MEPQKELNIGVINPYALAEVVLNKRIRWEEISNQEEILESTLQTPFEKLFDPKDESPLYAGLRLEKDFSMKKLSGKEALESVEKLSIPGTRVSPSLEKFAELKPDRVRETLKAIVSDQPEAVAEWNPPQTAWVDMGDFFEEATEPGDPVQGALGDCYFIAALGAVAWSRPYAIAHRNRRTGTHEQAFVDMVEFLDNGSSKPIEVTERVPVTAGIHQFKFARSSEAGEVWPAVYEKAYAKMKTGVTSDRPEYPRIAGGDPVRACAELIGGNRNYVFTSSKTADQLWTEVRKHSRGCRTFDPMVAWTYSSSAAAPDPDVDYAAMRIVANHAYTLLGWTYQGNEKYIVLRNPWGTHTPTQDVLAGQWLAHDVSYWRPVGLSNRGFFALKAPTFKKYFAGLGWAT
jgi:hypothetical protein